MARTILAAATVVWLGAGAMAVGIGLLGSTGLQRLLPPLAIDLAALGGAVVAIGAVTLLIGAAHASVLLGLRAERRRAAAGGVLLSGTLTALLVSLTAAAATSAASTPDRAIPMLLGGIAAFVAGASYCVATVSLVAEIRSRTGT
jgi:hypothetical protein